MADQRSDGDDPDPSGPGPSGPGASDPGPSDPGPSDPGSSDPTAVVVVDEGDIDEPPTETISQPAKVIRIAAMTKELLEEVRRAALDEASRTRLKEIFETSVAELADGISSDLRDELSRLTLPFDSDIPSDSELRVAQAQLVGWLEGLFHGIQAAMFTQQAAAAQVEEARRRGLPVGSEGPGRSGPDMGRPGNYL